jgi:glycosyltransferase involved in cell wall biosynthesis
MTVAPFVTVLIPSHNEQSDIVRCLDAVESQDYPHDLMEVLLVDGGSTDGTASLARIHFAAGGYDGRIIGNSAGNTPSNLNSGLAQARGEIVCRVDARSVIPPDYIRLCVDTLVQRPEVAVTGGAQIALPPDTSLIGAGIARALNNRLAMGASAYRSGARSGATDTVYLGAFRTSQLRDTGGWDEAMLSNQDFELNRRLGRQGTIWFDSRLEVGYIPRSTLRGILRQYHRFGRWKVRYWRTTGDAPRPRQLVLMIVPPVSAAAAGAFILTGRRPVLRLLGTISAAAAGLLAVDATGSRSSTHDIRVRLISCVVMACVSCGWLSGIARESVTRARVGSAIVGHDQADKASRMVSRLSNDR